MIGTGFLIGHKQLVNFNFDPDLPCGGCCICGAVFQPPNATRGSALTELAIRSWRDRHNKKHTEREHLELKMSGRRFTPEAAARLTQYGIIDFGGMLTDNEVEHAMRIVSGTPTEDAEGVAD